MLHPFLHDKYVCRFFLAFEISFRAVFWSIVDRKLIEIHFIWKSKSLGALESWKSIKYVDRDLKNLTWGKKTDQKRGSKDQIQGKCGSCRHFWNVKQPNNCRIRGEWANICIIIYVGIIHNKKENLRWVLSFYNKAICTM